MAFLVPHEEGAWGQWQGSNEVASSITSDKVVIAAVAQRLVVVRWQ